jgi:transcriptional regulator with XRE-family HTH domain
VEKKLKDEIKGLIISKGYKMQEVAQYLGMSVQNLNRKLNEETLRLTEYRKILEFINKEVGE